MGSQGAPPPKRPVCDRCVKPARICLCARLNLPHPLDNRIAVTILQHSLEIKHPLNSTRVAKIGLRNLTIVHVTDVNITAHLLVRPTNAGKTNHSATTASFDNFDKYSVRCSGEEIGITVERSVKPNIGWVLDTPVGKSAVANGFVVSKLQRKAMQECKEPVEFQEFEITLPPGSALLFPCDRSVKVEAVDFEVTNLVVLDGTWGKATRMYHENPWLQLLPHVKVESVKESLYSEVRHEPKVGCLSTIESIVCAMKGLGEEMEGFDMLLEVFESMIQDQRRCKDDRLNGVSPMS